MIWLIVGVAVLVIAVVALLMAPARCTVLIDTATSTARIEQKLFWGFGPLTYKRILPQTDEAVPMPAFYDTSRIGPALMTPGLADATYKAVTDIFKLKPTLARFELLLNLPEPGQTRVVETAVQAVMAMAPAPIRQAATLGKCETPGAELHAKFEVLASPGQLNAIYNGLKESRSGHEFRKRLKKKPKSPKRPIREVQAP